MKVKGKKEEQSMEKDERKIRKRKRIKIRGMNDVVKNKKKNKNE